MLNDVTTTYNDGDGDGDGDGDRRGGLIIDWNDDGNGGVGSDINDELNKDDNHIQRAIDHGMGGTYNFFLSLYSQ